MTQEGKEATGAMVTVAIVGGGIVAFLSFLVWLFISCILAVM